ncbi:MAG: thioredoxin family protein [Betaproteobacteria bacterium]
MPLTPSVDAPHTPRLWSAAVRWGAILMLALLGAQPTPATQTRLDLGSPPAATSVLQTPEVRVELVAHAPHGIVAGTRFELGLLLQHQPGWHTYWKNPGDSGLPTELHWSLPSGLGVSDVNWPTPVKITIGQLTNFGFENTILLPVTVTVANTFRPTKAQGNVQVVLNATWLVCRQECIPQEGAFALNLPAQGSTAEHAALFDAARQSRPQDLTTPLQARLDGRSLVLSATQLPDAWTRRAINVFPEATDVFTTSAIASQSDRVAYQPGAPVAGTQYWSASGWSVRLPLSPQRSTSPAEFSVVLALGGRSVRATAVVSGSWPAAEAVAETSDQAPATTVVTERLKASTQPGSGLADSQAWLWALASAFVGGLILNLMPCVFPVLAIKVLGFASPSARRGVSPRVLGLSYMAGVVVSMAALGGALLAFRAAGEQLGWGFQLQSPTVVAGLALLFTLTGLNLMGLFDLTVVLPGRLAGLQLRHPVADAALSGVLAVAIASPCTAPFMGASLGLALTLESWQAMGVFIALGLGLALPFALASALPSAANYLPKPGPWMEQLRQFLAFPMAATVLWLLWIFAHMLGVDAAASLAVFLLALTLLAWCLRLTGRARWVFGGLAGLTMILLLEWVGPPLLTKPVSSALQSPVAQGDDTSPKQPAAWQAWSAQRVHDELAQGNPVFVDFTAAWCITCQYNKQTVLADTAVLEDFAAKGVTLLRADWTQRDPAISQALASLQRSGVPVYVVYQAERPPTVLSELLSKSELRRALEGLKPRTAPE